MTAKEWFLRLFRKLKELDEARNYTCDLCKREVFENERLCKKCRETLPVIELGCPLCGRRVREAGVCLECKKQPLVVQRARSCCLHEGGAAALVLRLKKGEKFLYKTLAEQMLPLLTREFPLTDALTFVPMTKKAEKKRGYNQSRLLAEELSRRTGKELLDVAEKRKETKAQKTLGRTAREENLKGAFHLFKRKELKGRRVLIVDDTMTTGATAGELAGPMLRAGAKSVELLTFTSVEDKTLHRNEKRKS